MAPQFKDCLLQCPQFIANSQQVKCVEGFQEAVAFECLDDIVQRQRTMGPPALYAGEISCNAEKVSLQSPLFRIKLREAPGTEGVQDHDERFLGEIFGNGD